MKRILYILSISVLSSSTLFAQWSTQKNYIAEQNIRTAGVTTQSGIDALTGGDIANSITYFDDFGRPIQSIAQQASPAGKDIIQHMDYDAYGKQSKTFLPFAATAAVSGLFDESALTHLTSFYNNSSNKIAVDTNPWAEAEIERSPFNRIIRQGNFGTDWQLSTGNTVKYEYTFNTTGDHVFEWEITTEGDLKLTSDHYYDANTLSVTIVKDENWAPTDGNSGTMRTFTNSKGQEILSRAYKGAETFDTYYVYDDFGNLRFIVPPKAIDELGTAIASISDNSIFTTSTTFPSTYPRNTVYYYMPSVTVTLPAGMTFTYGFELKPYPVDASVVNNLLYIYTYDDYNRVIESKAPGAEPVYTVYDVWHRPVFNQDGNQRAAGEWSFVKYDYDNRPIITGYFTSSSTRAGLQAATNTHNTDRFETRGSSIHGYTNDAYPDNITEAQCLSVIYYDDYDFASSWGTEYQFDNSNGINNGPYLPRPNGKVTGGKVKILGDNTWLKSTVYYDFEYREIQTADEHHLNSYNKAFLAYDFVGNVTQSKLVHWVNTNKSVSITKRNEYDDAGRLTKVYHQLDEQPEILMSKLDYNELGELIEKDIHSEDETSFIQSVDYRYNIRGWLTNINNASRTNDGSLNDDTGDLFGMELYYNDGPSLAFNDQFNGNMSGMTWGNSRMGNKKRSYSYSYDALDRLTASAYKEFNGRSWGSTGYFDENITGYDKNGNITALNRKSNNTTIDNLTYTYEDVSNRLKSVSDASGNAKGFNNGASSSQEYGYDDNGNLQYDQNKGISDISYNRMNLPDVVTFDNGNELHFVYDAAGAKLTQKIYKGGSLKDYTDYVGGFIYENDSLRLIASSEGRIVVDHIANDFSYDYQYYLTDHLGNVRVVYGPQQRIYTATMESELSTTEEAMFKNLDKTRENNDTYNHTVGGGQITYPNESSMLNSHMINADKSRRIIGPAKGLKVYPGDVIDMEVWARYSQVNTSEVSASAFLFSAMTASFGITAGDNPQIYSAFNSFIGGTALINQTPLDVPKACLNYIFFDKNYENPQFGFKQVSSSANGAHEKLSLSKTITEAGYIYIYVSNESTLNVNAYFDDLKITHTSAAALLQADEYFAYGLPIEDLEYKKDDIVPNRFLYQGKEWMDEDDLALAMYDFHARMYDPALGRFMAVDPKGHLMPEWSPYAGMFNDPINYVDPDGEFPVLAELAGLTNGIKNLVNGDNFFDGFADGWTQSWEITGGLFQWDSNLNFGQNLWNITSKFTWELPQTTLGFTVSQGLNVGTLVNDVNYFHGATVLDSDLEGGAFTLGSYIVGPEGFRPDFRDHLFVHEFGHYLQSKRLGPLYLNFVAFPSVTDFYLGGLERHDTRWYEVQASRLAADYFQEEFGGVDASGNPISGDPNLFDRNAFINDGVRSRYVNPRNGGRNLGGHPQQSQFHWTDIPINGLYNGGLGLFGYWFF
jgi:RHS repeat-associated protein